MWFITITKEEQFEYIKNNYPATAGIHSKRLTRRRFFSKIETEIQAYLLGLYASDGNITEKRKRLEYHYNKKMHMLWIGSRSLYPQMQERF